jgi:hypothetical protein
MDIPKSMIQNPHSKVNNDSLSWDKRWDIFAKDKIRENDEDSFSDLA